MSFEEYQTISRTAANIGFEAMATIRGLAEHSSPSPSREDRIASAKRNLKITMFLLEVLEVESAAVKS